MGKMKEWLIQMQEDASELTRSQWIEVHGASNVWVYDYEQGEADPDWSCAAEEGLYLEENWK